MTDKDKLVVACPSCATLNRLLAARLNTADVVVNAEVHYSQGCPSS